MRIALHLLAGACIAASTQAQAVVPGDRVRITSASLGLSKADFRLVSAGDDSLTVARTSGDVMKRPPCNFSCLGGL